MTDTYKLLFRGEVLEGQHPAVVRRRLATLASYRSEHLELLFSGRPVVVKREADAATAARLQALFKQAGARLRVMSAGTEGVAAVGGSASRNEAATGFQLLPSGSPVLRDDERRRWEPRDVDTSRLSVAEMGTRLGEVAALPVIAVTVPEFDVAPAGAMLADTTPPSAPRVPDISHLRLQ